MDCRLRGEICTRLLVLVSAFVVAFASLALPTSSDGVVYLQWYRNLGWENDNMCHSFEPGFCVISLVLKSLGLGASLFLAFWTAVCYGIVGLTLLRCSSVRQLGPIFAAYLVSLSLLYFVYLQPSITQHLTRQYVSGALIIFALMSTDRRATIATLILAPLFHAFSLVFIPFVVVQKYGQERWFLLFTLCLAVTFSTFFDLRHVLGQFFLSLNEIGTDFDIFLLRSMYFRWNIYSSGWTNPLGYAGVSFRGSAIVLALFFLLPVCKEKFRYVGVILYAVTLLALFHGNDLLFHRIYHYFREFMIIPSGFVVFWLIEAVFKRWSRVTPSSVLVEDD